VIRPRSTLTIKLFRDLWRLRAQAVAIAMVIAAGVGTVVMAAGLVRSLDATRNAYYAQYRFADVFAPLIRAPAPVIDQIRRLPGVAAADSRVSTRAILNVAQVTEPVSARIHSLPGGPGALNRLVLRSGRLPDPRHPGEVVANDNFVRAASLQLGDGFTAVLHGKQVRMQLVGTVLSPEYIYVMAPGQILPDDRRYGVLWMARAPLAAALDLNQSFNDVLVAVAPGAEPEEVVRRLDLLLAPYGGVSAYTRAQQISDRFVASEIDQLKTMAAVLPPVFLLVAAFLLNIVLARLVDTEREVIGLLKAFGLPQRAILAHYVQLALLLSLGGLVVGIALGIFLGQRLAALYQHFYSFPFLNFQIHADVLLIAVAATLVPVVLGATTAVLRSARLTPAAAMHPPAPPDYATGRFSGWIERLGPDEPSRIVVRGLLRRPIRSLLSILGLAAALSLYIASQSAPGSIERMIELGFGKANRSDLVVTFMEPRDARAVHELERIPGVLAVQPFRAVEARFRHGTRAAREGIDGAETGGALYRIVDVEGRTRTAPPEGAIVSSRLAALLGARRGDVLLATVTEGERPTLRLRIVDIVESPFGSSATISRARLNRLLHEGNTLSGAYLAVDGARLSAIYRRLKESPLVAAISVSAAAEQSIRQTVRENFVTMTLIYAGLAALVVAGVVYNNGRISLSEQARDLASLRVLGFRRGEVAFILFGEQALLVILSLPLGIAGGLALWRYLSAQFNSDLFTIPFVVEPQVLGQGVLVVTAAAAATALFVRRRLDRLDLVSALKTRE
jgi:putative ABC transport system permease protein